MDGNKANNQANGRSWQGGNAQSHWSGMQSPEHHSQPVGERGPILEQDSMLHETLETFVHEKILERPVHVKGLVPWVILKPITR